MGAEILACYQQDLATLCGFHVQLEGDCISCKQLLVRIVRVKTLH